MKTPSGILLSVVSSIAVSSVIVIVAFGFLRSMNAESRRIEAFGDIADKTHTLHILTASLREESLRGDIPQVKEILLSLEEVS